MATGFRYLNEQAGYNRQAARSAAIRRAAASGRTNPSDVEAMIAPVEERAARSSSEALKSFALSENERYNQLEAQADFQKAAMPLQPTAFEKIGTLGSGALAYGQGREYQSATRDFFRSLFAQPSAEQPFSLPSIKTQPYEGIKGSDFIKSGFYKPSFSTTGYTSNPFHL